jgi:hypothetical protein
MFGINVPWVIRQEAEDRQSYLLLTPAEALLGRITKCTEEPFLTSTNTPLVAAK